MRFSSYHRTHRLINGPEFRSIAKDRGKTVTKLDLLRSLGLALSEKQIPQVIEKPESGDKRKEALERADMRPRQVRYQAALRPDLLLC